MSVESDNEVSLAVARLAALSLKKSNDAALEVIEAESRVIKFIDKLTDAAMVNQLQSREVMRGAICDVVMDTDYDE